MPSPAFAQTALNLSAPDLFRLADEAIATNQPSDAEAMYRALARDPDPEIRAEARFRLGMMLSDQKRYTDAALAFRALLDEKPDAARVRLELARILVIMGDEVGARRALRQAQAAGLPPDVAIAVNKFAAALRTTKMFGGSVELALAPDSNINRATNNDTLDTVIAPLTLDDDAKQQSGVGLKLGGQGYFRLPVSAKIGLLARLSGQANLYRKSQFSDVAGSLVIGPEITSGRHRIRPGAGITYRYFGGPLYARNYTASLNWLYALNARTQIDIDMSASRLVHTQNQLQDGGLYDAAVAVERTFTPRLGGSVTLSASRQDARDRGYSTWSGGLSLLAWRDTGRMTLYGIASYRRLEADARLFLFPERRKDAIYRATAGVVFRNLAIGPFAPLVRANHEHSASSVGLYDYRRTSIEMGISRAF